MSGSFAAAHIEVDSIIPKNFMVPNDESIGTPQADDTRLGSFALATPIQVCLGHMLRCVTNVSGGGYQESRNSLIMNVFLRLG